MTERTLRIIMGLLILVALYFELPELLTGLIIFMLFEGITNWRLPIMLQKLQGEGRFLDTQFSELEEKSKFNIEAERVMRFAAAALLGITYFIFNEQLWFFPWFMGFAFFGAGISGVCPMLMSIKYLGFR